MNQTPAQVDPIELRKKLRRLGIGAKFQFSQTAAMDAVTEAMGSGDPEIEATEGTLCGVTLEGDVEATCPKCGEVFDVHDAEIEGDVDIEAAFIAEHIETGESATKRPTRLEANELAYMVHNWAMQWGVPE